MIILLSTNWSNDYFAKKANAPYNISDPGILKLANQCPIKAIGYYRNHISGRASSATKFVYLEVKGIEQKDNSLYFNFEPVLISKTESIALFNQLSPNIKKSFFAAIDDITGFTILKNLNEIPPKEWQTSTTTSKSPIPNTAISTTDYKQFIGNYFLELTTNSLGNNDFENRIKDLLIALGFDAKQRGHTVKGTFPDGYAQFNNNILVYDCKNSENFFPLAEDRNALEGYLRDAKNLYSDNNIFSVFIVKSLANNLPPNHYYLTVENLIYLLYKKLSMGNQFHLSHLTNILQQSKLLDKNVIDNYWFPLN